jgi:integrase
MRIDKSMLTRAQQYVAYRRNLGFKLAIEGGQILNFARYADSIRHRGPLTVDLALAWARLATDATRLYQARRLEIVRGFARYLSVFESQTQIPGNRLLGPAHRRTQPHIYSAASINTLISAAEKLAPTKGLRPRTYATLIGLMAATGLRTSEALHLLREDVNFEDGLITIRDTKFHKSRLVPVDDTVGRALRTYAAARDAHFCPGQSSAFLLGENRRALSGRTVHWTFRRLCKACGLRPAEGGNEPRLYDLRHTFCTRRLLQWHEQGVDVEQALPALSTYVGHVKVTDTYWYLSAIPELLAVTGAKFERFAHEAKGA